MKSRLLSSLILAVGLSAPVLAAAPDAASEKAFDRQKGKIYAAYVKVLREQPQLQGSMDLQFTVSETGKASGCRVVRSELESPQLEGRICQVIEAMAFDPRKTSSTVVKRVEFFPAG